MVARVLGAFEVRVEGRTLQPSDWRRRSAEQLVKLLIVTPGHRLTREVATETLWPERRRDGTAALRKAIHFARRALTPYDAAIADGGHVSLEASFVDVDLDRLDAALDAVARASPGSAPPREALDFVLELGGLELLPEDGYEAWLLAPRERLLRDWERLALPAARQMLAQDRRDDAHALVDRLLERDPTDEAAYALAMEIFAAEGRHRACRRRFDRCAQALRGELGVRPSESTVEILRAGESRTRR